MTTLTAAIGNITFNITNTSQDSLTVDNLQAIQQVFNDLGNMPAFVALFSGASATAVQVNVGSNITLPDNTSSVTTYTGPVNAPTPLIEINPSNLVSDPLTNINAQGTILAGQLQKNIITAVANEIGDLALEINPNLSIALPNYVGPPQNQFYHAIYNASVNNVDLTQTQLDVHNVFSIGTENLARIFLGLPVRYPLEGAGTSGTVPNVFDISGLSQAVTQAQTYGSVSVLTGTNVVGDANADLMYGINGSDTLIAGTGNDTMTADGTTDNLGSGGNDVFEFGLTSGAGEVTNYSTSKSDMIQFNGNVSINNPLGTNNLSAHSNGAGDLALSISGSSHIITIDQFFNTTTPTALSAGNATVTAYQLNLVLNGQRTTQYLTRDGKFIILGTNIIVPDGQQTIIVGTGSNNTIDLSTATANININVPAQSAGTINSGAQIGDTFYNIQNIIGNSGNDTVVDDNINFTAQDNTISVIDGANNNVFVGGNDTVAVHVAAGEASANDTLTARGVSDVFEFSNDSGNNIIANYSTAGADIVQFDGTISVNDPLVSENLTGSTDGNGDLILSVSTGPTVQINNFFNVTSTTGISAGNMTVLAYQINLGLNGQSTPEYVGKNGEFIIQGTDFIVPDGQQSILIGTSANNAIDLSTATGNISINVSGQSAGIISGGDPISDTFYNIQNIIGDSGNDVITDDNISFTAQNSTSSVVNGTGNAISVGVNDTLTVAAASGEPFFQDTINATGSATTDVINFGGHSIAAALISGATDSFGRAYSLNGTTLTVTDGADSLTLNNFQNYDYGINITYHSSYIFGVTFQGIDDNGTIVGYVDGTGSGFTDNNGLIEAIPGQSANYRISNNGAITNLTSYNENTANGEFIATDINSNGAVVGYIAAPNVYNEAALDIGGTVTPLISDPNASLALAINDSGTIIGQLNYGASGITNEGGYIFNSGTEIYYPGSGGSGLTTAINDNGVIAGIYQGALGNQVFTYNNGVYSAIAMPNWHLTSMSVAGINDEGQIVGEGEFGGSPAGFVVDTRTIIQSVSQSNSIVSIAASQSTAFTGNSNTLNVGNNADVSVTGTNNIINGNASDQIAAIGNNNAVSVATYDPVTLSGESNTVTIFGSNVNASDDDLSSGNTFSVESGSTGDDIILGGTDDAVNDSSTGNTILAVGGNDTFAVAGNDTLTLSGSNTVSGSSGADLTTDILTFDGQSAAVSVTSGNVATNGLTYTLSGTTLTVADGSDALTINGFANGDFGVDVLAAYVPPLAETDNINTNSQASVSGNVLVDNGNGPDTDPNGLTLSTVAETLTTAEGGTFTLGTDGNFTYTAATGYRGSDTATYTLEDTAGLTATGTVDISNIFTNRAPTAVAETVDATQQGDASGNVLIGNSDSDGDAFTAVAQTLTTTNGNSVTINSDGSFTLQATAGFRGNDSFTYADEDSYGAESTGTVTVDNLFANRAPTTSLLTINANDNATATGNVLATDSDPDGDSVSALAQTITTVNGGTVTLAANGAFTYTAATGFRGNDSFSYTAEDFYGATTAGTVDINNIFTDRAPTANAETFDASQQSSISTNVLTGNSDSDGDTFSAIAQTLTTANGNTVTIGTNGSLILQAASGFRGTDSFTYTDEDTYGAESSGIVTVNNLFTNRAPVTALETVNAANSATVSGSVLTNDSDPDGDNLSAVAQTLTTADGGTVTITNNGEFTYTAATGFRGNDSFSYAAEDAYGATTAGTVDVDNVFTNRAPTANAETFNAAQQSSIAGNVLTGNTDPDGDTVSVVAQTITTTDGNAVTINANGSFTLQAATGFRGSDSFTYTDKDNYGAESTGTVTVNNLFTNRAPTANNETLDASQQSTATGNVLIGNSDPDSDNFVAGAQTLTTANGNTVTINANGSFTLQAATGFRGTDSFTYTDEDTYGAESSGTVTVNNLFTNRAPVTALETVNAANTAMASGNVLTNDSDPDGDDLTAVAQTVASADGGTVTIASNGSFTYTAASGIRGTDSFSYTAEDAYGAETTGTVDISNVFTNRAPTAVAETVNAANASTASGNVLTANSDPDGDSLSAIAQTVTTTNGNTVTINTNGTFTLTAAAGFRGTDSFSYIDEDSYGAESTATVTVNNLFTNRAPTAVAETVNAANAATASGSVLTGNSDPDGDTLSAVAQTLTTAGGNIVTINADGSFTLTAATGFRGTDSFTYTDKDSYGAEATGTVTVSNLFTNRPPYTNLATINANNQASATGNALVNDGDPDGDAISAVAQTITTAHGGTVTIASNGNFSYTAATGFRGNDSFAYTVEDSHGATTAGTVDLSNVFTDRAPVGVNDSFTVGFQSSVSGNVLSNDTDADGDSLSVIAQNTTTANGGQVVLNSNGTFTYQAPSGYIGTDSFNYTVSDPYGETSTATVTLTIPGLIGTSGNDSLLGTANNEPIYGLAGNDTLSDGGYSDTLVGGTGNDSFIVNNASTVVTENSGEGTDIVLAGVSYTLGANLENLTLTGTASLTGTGNTGNDVLTSNTGVDKLIGKSTSGADTFVVNNAADTVTEANTDTTDLVISSVNWTLGSNTNQLTLTGSSSRTGTGNSNTDILSDGTGSASDTLIGESTNGSDTFIVNNASDKVSEAHSGSNAALVESSVNWTLGTNTNKLTLTAGAISGTGNSSTDILSDAGAGVAADTLIGESSNGSDTFIVNNSNDTISEAHYSSNAALVIATANVSLVSNIDDLTFTGTANLSGLGNYATDILTSNTGTDTLVGRSLLGTDTFVVNNVNDIITETYDGSQASVEADVNWTLGTHIANLILEGSANLTGTGNNKVDTITGNTGNDVLIAGSGNANLIGNSSTGNDTFIVNSASDNATETNSGNAIVESSANFTLGTNNTNKLILTAGSLKGTGNSNTDILSDDGVGGGADTLVGESSSGSDTFLVNNSNDTVSEAHYSSNTALVVSTANFSLVSNVDDLTFTGTANLSGLGNYATDIITSNTGTDTLVGRSLVGSDTFVVNNANDIVTETYDGSTALVISDANWTLGTHFSDLTLTASGITGTGNNKNDTITDDGSYGGDTLVGGTGADDFVLAGAAAYNSIDVLQNFSTARSDKIDISSLMVAAGYHSGTSTLADFVHAVNSGSSSLLQVDTTGTGSHFQTVATITSVTNINVATYVSNGNLVV